MRVVSRERDIPLRNNSIVKVGHGSLAARFGPTLPLALIAGPCQIESRAHALEMAQALREISGRTGVPVIYKSSYDKANRTSAAAARGIGMADGLAILSEVRAATGLPVLTDVHAPDQCAPAAESVD